MKRSLSRTEIMAVAFIVLCVTTGIGVSFAGEGLVHRLSDSGINYLAYDGTVLYDGDSPFFGSQYAEFRKPDGTSYTSRGNNITRNGKVFTIQADWGAIVKNVRQEGDTLLLDVAVTNSSKTDTLVQTELMYTYLNYEKAPTFGSFNSGAFWASDKLTDFGSYQFAGGGMPRLHVDFGKGCFSLGRKISPSTTPGPARLVRIRLPI